MKILIHLVSGQNMPNYIAYKIINPDKNIFLYTSESESQCKLLEKLIRNSSKELIEAWDYNKIQKRVTEIIDNYKDEEIFLNFTSGNKIMSTAVFNLFKDSKKKCYYINTEKNEYIYFDYTNDEIKSLPIEIKFELEAILLLNGQDFEFVNYSLSEKQLELIDLIIKNENLQKLVLDIASKIESKKSFQEVKKEGKFKDTEITLINDNCRLVIIYEGKELFNYVGTDTKIIDIFGGKWFEYECYNKLKALNYFDELKWNCNIKRKSRTSNEIYTDKNEIDIIGNKGPYPYIFECKSGNIKAEAVDKLVAIKESYIGRYASLIFISKYPLSTNNTNHKNVIEKIKDNKIVHLNFNQLDNKNEVVELFNEKANLK